MRIEGSTRRRAKHRRVKQKSRLDSPTTTTKPIMKYDPGYGKVTMPFGRHKGVPLVDLPSDYVDWLRRKVPLFASLALAMESVHGGRFKRKADDWSPPPPPPPRAEAPSFDLRSLRRKFAAKYHPDRTGGDTAVMRALNDVFDELEGMQL